MKTYTIDTNYILRLYLKIKYRASLKTIQKRLDNYRVREVNLNPRRVMLVMNTTYFEGCFELMVFRDVLKKKNVLWKFVEYGTIAHYQEGIRRLEDKGFEEWLNEWFEKWREFLNEKTEDPLIGRKTFTHRRLRSAYNSLKSHIPYLFTYLKYRRLSMPNTTNFLDGFFSHLKNSVNIHRGLKVDRKRKLIQDLVA